MARVLVWDRNLLQLESTPAYRSETFTQTCREIKNLSGIKCSSELQTWLALESRLSKHTGTNKNQFGKKDDRSSFWPWKKSPLGCLTAAADTESQTTVSAPMASVLSLDCILAWNDGMDDWTATQRQNSISEGKSSVPGTLVLIVPKTY